MFMLHLIWYDHICRVESSNTRSLKKLLRGGATSLSHMLDQNAQNAAAGGSAANGTTTGPPPLPPRNDEANVAARLMVEV